MKKNLGKFIVIEGLDCSGKTTITKNIKKYLIKQGILIKSCREPGGNILSEKIRNILINNDNVHYITEIFLIYASRNQLLFSFIKKQIAMGYSIITDRFFWSTLAYQGNNEKISKNKLIEANDIFFSSNIPDLYIYIDISIDTLKLRMKNRKKNNVLDNRYKKNFKNIRKSFLHLVSKKKNAYKVDGNKNFKNVFLNIKNIILGKLFFK